MEENNNQAQNNQQVLDVSNNETQQVASLDNVLDDVKLSEQTSQLVGDIIDETDIDKLRQLTNLFNVAQVKKNALRILKLESLLGAVEDQAIKRIETRPDEFTNKEILDYLQIVQNQIDKANQTIRTIDNQPMIQINQQNNQITINNGLDSDSKDNVINAVKELLSLMQQQTEQESQDNNIIDVEEVTDESNEQEVDDVIDDDLIAMLSEDNE